MIAGHGGDHAVAGEAAGDAAQPQRLATIGLADANHVVPGRDGVECGGGSRQVEHCPVLHADPLAPARRLWRARQTAIIVGERGARPGVAQRRWRKRRSSRAEPPVADEISTSGPPPAPSNNVPPSAKPSAATNVTSRLTNVIAAGFDIDRRGQVHGRMGHRPAPCGKEADNTIDVNVKVKWSPCSLRGFRQGAGSATPGCIEDVPGCLRYSCAPC